MLDPNILETIANDVTNKLLGLSHDEACFIFYLAMVKNNIEVQRVIERLQTIHKIEVNHG